MIKRKIIAFHADERGDWVAELECGHKQHVRRNPPWTIRPWVMTLEGREQYIGHSLQCQVCHSPSDTVAGEVTDDGAADSKNPH